MAFLTLSSQSTEDSTDFSSPKSLVETFIQGATDMDKEVLSTCFSERSPGEWDDIRNKTMSSDDLRDIQEFVVGAEITKIEMQGNTKAIVFVKFKSRDEQIHTIREHGRWFISDFYNIIFSFYFEK
jgi:hypothetical protein